MKWYLNSLDSLLKKIANDKVRAFFISLDKKNIIAPYDGGIDFILRDKSTVNIYKEK